MCVALGQSLPRSFRYFYYVVLCGFWPWLLFSGLPDEEKTDLDHSEFTSAFEWRSVICVTSLLLTKDQLLMGDGAP